jgi:hypothetical protein
VDPIPFILLEVMCLLGGLTATAIGFGVHRLPATPASEAYLARVGPQLRLLGPLMLLGAAIFPVTMHEGDDWYRRACGIGFEVLLAGAVVYAIRPGGASPPSRGRALSSSGCNTSSAR